MSSHVFFTRLNRIWPTWSLTVIWNGTNLHHKQGKLRKLNCSCNSTRGIPYIPPGMLQWNAYLRKLADRIRKAALLSGSGIGLLAPPCVLWLSVHVADVLRHILMSSPFCLGWLSGREEGSLPAELRRPCTPTAAAHTLWGQGWVERS